MKKSRVLPYFLSLIIVLFSLFYSLSLSGIKNYTSTPIIEDVNGIYLTEGDGISQSYGYWDINSFNDLRITKAIIAIEDRRFYNHPGVDLRALLRALKENVVNGNPQGGSTLAMQVIRIQEISSRNLITKIFETTAAFFMVMRYGKEKVLNQYLKIVPMGRKIHGVSYASRRYFKKPVEDLSWAEAAILASLPKAPGRMDITNYKGMERAKIRAKTVLKRLFDQDYIDHEMYNRSLDVLKDFKALGVETRPGYAFHYILRLYEQLEQKGEINYKTSTKTNLDLNIQKYLTKYVNSIYQELKQKDVDNIAIIISNKNGEILGYKGSQDYFNKKHHGAINYANRRRSSGSTLKPFLYIKGLDDGAFYPNSIVDDLPIHIVDDEGSFIAANYDEDFLGPMLYRKTLANSRNIPSVRILEEIGLYKTYDYFMNLNFIHRDLSPEFYGYGLIIGGLYVTLEDLVTAYGSILNDGKEFKLKWFKGDDNSGGIKIGSRFNSRLITQFLLDPTSRLPSFPRMGPMEYPYPVAVKTGTSQGYRDAWTIAYSQDYITGIWLGRHDNGKMNHVSGSTAAKYLKPIMNYLHPQEVKGLNHKPFKLPENCVEVDICPLSGKLKGENCDNSVSEFFKESEVPVDYCDVHIRLAVDKFTNKIADHQTPIENIETRIFVNLPSRYAVWSEKQGFETPKKNITDVSIPKMVINEPRDRARFIYDFEIPDRFQSIPLVADIDPQIPYVDWYINDVLYKRVSYPYKARFQLKPGEYNIELRSLNYSSGSVKIFVE